MKEMNKIKIFISQPMNGKSESEILEERKKIMDLYPEAELIDSFIKEAPKNATPLWYLGESIKLMGDADIVYFAEGWAFARGCIVEHCCALHYGKTVHYAK